MSTNRRILVIDDNHAIHDDFRKILCDKTGNEDFDISGAELFGEVLPKKNGFVIDSAYQGREGLALVEQAIAEGRPYPMAFVDVRMPPGWDGIETIAHIWETYPDLQVVVCTAYSDYSQNDMLDKLGKSDRLLILKKPFDSVEVMQLAGALTEKWSLLQKTRCHRIELEDTVARRTEELRLSEERFRLIAENAATLIAIVDREGRRLYSSPSYQKLLGYTAEELATTSALSQIHPDERETVFAAIGQTMQSGIGQTIVFQMQPKQGPWRTLESHNSPFRNSAGLITGVLMVATDITERKGLELQLRHAQKLEAIGRLAAGIAHEINTPTQFIGDNVHFLQDAFGGLQPYIEANAKLLGMARDAGVPTEMIAEVEAARDRADLDYLQAEVPKAISQSIEGVERVAKIVRAMKDFSHPGSHSKTMLDLNRAIDSTLTVCRSEWKYVADLVTEFDPNLPLVQVLPGEFNQVILNLMINAAHAIGDVVGDGGNGRGTITVSTCHSTDWIEVRIRDTGAGIPEKIRDRIFDPFFTTKEVGKGTGQGLAIARSVVVDKHGGSISFETKSGEGTCFIIRLPSGNAPSVKAPGTNNMVLNNAGPGSTADPVS